LLQNRIGQARRWQGEGAAPARYAQSIVGRLLIMVCNGTLPLIVQREIHG